MQNSASQSTAARDAGQITHSRTVVTYHSPRGNHLSVCTRCLDADAKMPRDYDGQEYCTVSHGRHYGHCDLQEKGAE